jgi:hypothetical protein
MRPRRPHPDCVWCLNSRTSRCRNSGQIKVATQRAARLNLSPRCDDLAGEPPLSSYIDALVPAALCSGKWRRLNGRERHFPCLAAEFPENACTRIDDFVRQVSGIGSVGTDAIPRTIQPLQKFPTETGSRIALLCAEELPAPSTWEKPTPAFALATCHAMTFQFRNFPQSILNGLSASPSSQAGMTGLNAPACRLGTASEFPPPYRAGGAGLGGGVFSDSKPTFSKCCSARFTSRETGGIDGT